MGIMDILNPVGAIADIGLGFGNLNMQKQNLRYQKDLQQQAWAREDNATQRRVADLKAAGLSPTLAAGSAAQASAPIQTHAPQYGGPSMQEKALNYLALTKMKADVSTTIAQKEIAEAKAKEAKHDAEINTGTPGITSTQNSGPLGYAKALVGFLGSDEVKNALNEMFTFRPSKPNAKPSATIDVGNAYKRDEYKWDSAESIGISFEKFKKQYGIKTAEELMKATYGVDWYDRMMNNAK